MRDSFRRIVLLILVAGLPLLAVEQPRYVFLIIGDGMGIAQRACAERYLQGKEGDDAKLQMDRLPVNGLTATAAHKKPITDSAAAGTALACGEKTRNGVIGMAADKRRKLRSIAEDARDAGMKVGIVSSVPIDHATPAAFYAKQPKRGQYYEIAGQIAGSGFDYFAAEPCLGNDKAKGRPLPATIAAEAGYTCVEGRDGLALKPGADTVLWQAPIGYDTDAADDDLRLLDLVDKGIELLDGEQGFFMMIEGGRIDWSGHANDLATNVRGTLDLDAVVERVLAFQAVHADDCLVVVTADHETGGLQTHFDRGLEPAAFAAAIDGQQGSYQAFNRALKGWRDEQLDAAALQERAIAFYGLGQLTEQEQQLLAAAVGKHGESSKQQYGKRNPIAGAGQQILDARCGVSWSTGGHTGTDVPTTAIGPGAERFAGKTDNTDIAIGLRELMAEPVPAP